MVEGNWPMPPGAQSISSSIGPVRAWGSPSTPTRVSARLGRPAPDPRRARPELGPRSAGTSPWSTSITGGQRPGAARAAIEALRRADLGILANHGVLIVGANVRAAHQRSVAFEQRCRNAWYVAAANGGIELPAAVRDLFERSDGQRFIGFWEAMARAELRADPTILEPR